MQNLITVNNNMILIRGGCFISPDQFLRLEINKEGKTEPTRWLLLIHLDFIWNTPLAKKT